MAFTATRLRYLLLTMIGAMVVTCLAGCRPGTEDTSALPFLRPEATSAPPGAALAKLRAKPPTVNEYWQNALKETYKSPLELKAQYETYAKRGLHFRQLMRGPNKPEIALTFDDGPHPDFTPKLLAILARYHVKATFFLVGEKAEQAPQLVKAEFAAGHCLGNHTYHHINLTKIPERLVDAEIDACGDVVKGITGQDMHLFRPPGGDYNRAVAEVVNGMGYTLVLWTDDPGDYASPGATVIEERTLDRVRNGGIILLHDGVQQTVDVLPQLIESLQ